MIRKISSSDQSDARSIPRYSTSVLVWKWSMLISRASFKGNLSCYILFRHTEMGIQGDCESHSSSGTEKSKLWIGESYLGSYFAKRITGIKRVTERRGMNNRY